MPSVSYNGQSFLLDGRRIWILGASLAYARIPEDCWADRIRSVAAGGFNTVSVPCPWSLHEPRKGRYHFEAEANVAEFVRLCGEEGLRVILRPGPFVGDGFDGGGLPTWLAREANVRLRERSEGFIDRMARYFRKLMAEVGDQLVTKDGPIILVQIEHGWACGNDAEAASYLGDVARILRETGVNVPLYNANNLWADPVGTIDSWQGRDDLLVNLRQLRLVQPDAPRLVSGFTIAEPRSWGGDRPEPLTPDDVLRRFAEILAAGAQPVVSMYHGGTNFGFNGGSLPGGSSVTTSAAAGAPLGEAGVRGPAWFALRRLALFARSFEHLFADLDPEYQPVTLDSTYTPGRTTGKAGATLSLVPLRGGGGKVVFVFSDRIGGSATLLMQNGIRLSVDLGDQPVGWFVADLDLQGRGRLDYANLCPVAMVGRRLVVFQGPARHEAVFSIGGTPVEATVPTGRKPLVVEHKGMQFVICNQQQVDNLLLTDDAVYVGATDLDEAGQPIAATGWARPWRIDADGKLAQAKPAPTATARRGRAAMKLTDWSIGDGAAYVDGTSPRYASLAGPEDLPSCGATSGYGWYAINLQSPSSQTLSLLAPGAGGRIHFYIDGAFQTLYGDGPGGAGGPFGLKLARGECTIVALVDNPGRYCEGHDLDLPFGFREHLCAVKPVTARPKTVERHPVDPFQVRGFIYGCTHGAGSDSMQLEWAFRHLKKSLLLLHFESVSVPGTIVLNDVPIAYHAGTAGSPRRTVTLDPAHETFKRGNNVLRFAPEPGLAGELKAAAKQIGLYECTRVPTEGARWSFAKWEPPAAGRFRPISMTEAGRQSGVPTWWSTQVELDPDDGPTWLDTTGLSKGQVLVNGRNLGRYFTRTRDGKAVGPQVRLLIPSSWLHADRPNEIHVFDEHGFSPYRARVVHGLNGDLD